MKRYTYPAVLYFDGETYMLAMHDLRLVTSGNKVEEVYEDMLTYMEGYFQCALAIDEIVEKPSDFATVAKSKTKNVVLLVSVKVKDGKTVE